VDAPSVLAHRCGGCPCGGVKSGAAGWFCWGLSVWEARAWRKLMYEYRDVAGRLLERLKPSS
jgi:hypothetical protein